MFGKEGLASDGVGKGLEFWLATISVQQAIGNMSAFKISKAMAHGVCMFAKRPTISGLIV
jgi:hypothetical protein